MRETMYLTRSNTYIAVLPSTLPSPDRCYARPRLTCTKPQYPRIDSEQICERGRIMGRRMWEEERAGWNREGGRKTEEPLYQQLLKPAGSPCRRCFLTQHNVTTIVLKLAAVGYSAAAFPCKASRMKPRQRRVAAGAAQTSPYPDRPLTALRRRPFLPSSLPSGPLSPTFTCSMRYILPRLPVPASSSFARCPATVVRAMSYILSHCAPSLSMTIREILTFW